MKFSKRQQNIHEIYLEFLSDNFGGKSDSNHYCLTFNYNN